ncbi:MAG: hypothetical protein ACSHW7_00580 [Patiriisocius sp.]|uniref:hypothetical protein n=1 Tax=Patiriisocius sp. TaxID=2822396 RepID=UPI003EF84099
MVKAASLLYAIFIALFISILCLGVLLIFNFKLNLDTHFNTQNDLIQYNRSAISHIVNGAELSDGNSLLKTTHRNKMWGLFSISCVESTIKNDTVSKCLLIGRGQSNNKPVLYLRNNDEALKISGETLIDGDIYISEMGISKVNIGGNSITNNPKHSGKILKSNKQLPSLDLSFFKAPEVITDLDYDKIKEINVFNDFSNETIMINATNSIADITMKGNLIVRSNDTLFIKKTAYLEDVIIIAPKIIYESGFMGNTQSFATSEILIEKDAHLQYPSVLFVAGNIDEKSSIEIRERALVEGVVIMDGNGLISEQNKKLVIDKDALVRGDVYCDGELSVYGTVEGSIVASSFKHETKTATYSNLIYGGKIVANKLPDDFFELSIADFFSDSNLIAIKQL